jgi:hypothetical protein
LYPHSLIRSLELGIPVLLKGSEVFFRVSMPELASQLTGAVLYSQNEKSSNGGGDRVDASLGNQETRSGMVPKDMHKRGHLQQLEV